MLTFDEYKALRRSLFPASGLYPATVSTIRHELERRAKYPPAPPVSLSWDRTYRGEGCRYLLDDAPDGLTVTLTVTYDDTADNIVDVFEGAGFQIDAGYRHDPTDDNEQERPHHSAVCVEIGGRDRAQWAWFWYADKIQAPAGMARGPAEEYRRATARSYAQAAADHAADRAEGRCAVYGVTATITADGEELWSDSLWGIDAKDDEEAAVYYWQQHGRDEAADVLADWRRAAAAQLARRAAALAAQAADILAG